MSRIYLTATGLSKAHGVLMLLALLYPVAAGAAQGPVNGGFEAGLDNWRVVAAEGASVTVSRDRPASGAACALLTGATSAQAIIVSEAEVRGRGEEPLYLSARVRRVSGTADLWIGLCPANGEPDTLDCAGYLLPQRQDTNWHAATIAIIAPTDAGLRATVAVMGDGCWAVDDVEFAAAGNLRRPIIIRRPGNDPPVAEPAVIGEALEPGWDPGGSIDARERRLLNQTELLLDVGGLAITMPAEVSIARGSRTGLITYCANRGSTDKEVAITVQGPPDVNLPQWRIPVAAKRSMQFRVPVQRLLLDECRLKLTFSVNNESVSAPVLVRTVPSYPTTGCTWPVDRLPSAEALAAAGRHGLGFHSVALQADGLSDMGTLIASDGGAWEYLVTPIDGAEATVDASLSTPEGPGARINWTPFAPADLPADARRAALCSLWEFLLARHHSPSIYSPAMLLTRGQREARPSFADEQWTAGTRIEECTPAAGDAPLGALVVVPPELPGPTVVGAALDGAVPRTPASHWNQVNAGWDLSSVRSSMREAELDLPLCVSGLRVAASGDRRVDAIKLARGMTSALYGGAKAVLLDAEMLPGADSEDVDPVARAAHIISAELSCAQPVAALGANETMSPRADALVTYMPFLRGDEGIIVMWNNSFEPVDVAIGLRSQPITVKLTRLAYSGEFNSTQFMHVFRFSERAAALQQPGIYTWLDPMDVTIVTMRLADPHIGWTRGVFDAETFKVELPPREQGPQWWQRFFYW